MARCQVRVTSWPGSLKAREGQPAPAFCHSAKLFVCVSHDPCFCESCLLFIISYTSISSSISKASAKTNKGESRSRYRLCSSLPALFHERGYKQSVALEGADCPHCERLPLRTLRSRKGSLRGRSLHQRSSRVLAPLQPRWSGSTPWCLQLNLAEGMETGESLSSSSPARSTARSLGSEARSGGLFPPGSALLLSSSEEVDVESVEYSAPQSPQYEELLEVVTRVVAKVEHRLAHRETGSTAEE